MLQYDCVIVGGGAVGLSLAIVLGQSNYKTLLIEQKVPGNNIQEAINARTIALSFASQRIYSMLGVWEKIKHPVSIQEVLVTVKGQYGSSKLTAQDQELPSLGYVVGTQELEQALEETLQNITQVDILRPATVLSREARQDAWYISVSGRSQKISCKLLIAADGMTSQLRQEQQISCQQTDYGHFAVMTNLHIEKGFHHIAYERFLPKGAIALLPWQQSLSTCVWTVDEMQAQSLVNLAEDSFLRECQHQLGSRIGKLTACGKRSCFPLKMQLATNQISARFLLMGNAAHSLHPIAAQGLNLSLRDIWQIRSQILKAKAQCEIGSVDFLESYLQARKNDQERVIFTTDKIARFMSAGPIPSWLRALGLTLFDSVAPLKRRFTAFGMGI
jgi:2-octaprenyl-6-methoxyphenol hydroxylase